MGKDITISPDGRTDAVVEKEWLTTEVYCSRVDLDMEFKLAKEMASTVLNYIKKNGPVSKVDVMKFFEAMVNF